MPKQNTINLMKSKIYAAWGSADGRIQNHLLVKSYDSKNKYWITTRFWVNKKQSKELLNNLMAITNKYVVELDYYELHYKAVAN